jgi:hypothetical protein
MPQSITPPDYSELIKELPNTSSFYTELSKYPEAIKIFTKLFGKNDLKQIETYLDVLNRAHVTIKILPLVQALLNIDITLGNRPYEVEQSDFYCALSHRHPIGTTVSGSLYNWYSASKNSKIYSQHVVANDLQLFRKVVPTTFEWTRLIEADKKYIDYIPLRPLPRETIRSLYVGQGLFNSCSPICLLNNTNLFLPLFIGKELKPAELVFALNSTARLVATAIDAMGYPQMPAVSEHRILHSMSTMLLQLSAGLLTSISLTSSNQLTSVGIVKNTLTAECLATQIEAIRIHKMRTDFEKVSITLEEYLGNVDKYIVNLRIPKSVNYISAGYLHPEGTVGAGIAVTVTTGVDTLLIPAKLLTSSSKKVLESGFLILDQLNRRSLVDLIDRSKYRAAVELLKENTVYWDGILQVLGSTNLEAIKESFDSGFAIPINTPVTDACKTQNAIAKAVFSSREFIQIAAGNKLFKSAQDSTNKLKKSYGLLQDNQYSTTVNLEQLKRSVSQAKKDLKIVTADFEEVSTSLAKKTAELELARASILEVVESLKGITPPEQINFQHELLLDRITLQLCGSYRTFASLEIYFNTENPLAYPEIKFLDGGYTMSCVDFIYSYRNGLNPELVSEIKKLNEMCGSAINSVEQFNFYKTLAIIMNQPDVEISSLIYQTMKPVKIYVDRARHDAREDCQIVTGGPYTIKLNVVKQNNGLVKSKLEGKVFLASAKAVFGIKPMGGNILQLKQHPHSKDTRIEVSNPPEFFQFLRAPTVMCFGESELPLLEATISKDLERIRHHLYAWITSAWTADEWGRSWQCFPTEVQVDLSGNFNKLEKTELDYHDLETKPTPLESIDDNSKS